MLVRLRTPDGTFRLTLEPDNTFAQLVTQVFRARAISQLPG